ncbi:MAG: Thioredoxin domain protein [Clostridia bacterium]|jgi:thiol-disulfide isomerase/thioredoxin|nr:Thioredoxin domain protein [Clostridia bacterium]
MITLHSVESVEAFIKENRFAFVYFTTETCNVCKALFPKVEKMLEAYPEIKAARVSIDEVTEAAGAFSIFTIPCILAYMDQKEIVREARYISMDQLEDKIARYYEFLE